VVIVQTIKEVFSSFSVDDLVKAKAFYGQTLGLEVEDGQMGLILHMVGGGTVFIYPKENHEPATFTVLNIEVDDLEAAVDELKHNGVELARYEGMDHDERGIIRGKEAGHGPDIGWFNDPSGNVVAILQR
jgi:predicted enzyme related to lactoylglutathione lyase